MSKTMEQKMNEGRQYRDIDAASFERRSDDEGRKTVEGYATVFNAPYVLYKEDGYTVREQVDAGAFSEADMADVIMQYNHEGRVFARRSNGTLEIEPDDKGLRIRANLGGTELGRQVYEEIEGGYTTKMSFGFSVVEDRRETVENNETGEVDILRTITRIGKLYDVSAVSIPANDATSISARSYGEGAIAEAREEISLKKERERRKLEIINLLEASK